MTVPLLPLAAALLAPLAPMGLGEAVDRALKHDASLEALAAQQSGAESSAQAIRGNYGPKLRLEGNVIVWDEEQKISFGGGGGGAFPALPPPQDAYQQAVAGIVGALGALGTPQTVREQVTSQATVQVVQPLVGLYGVSKGAEAADRGVEVTRAQAQSRRRQVEMDTVRGYFRTLQAEALGRAAAQQVESLAAQEKKVLSLEANGVIGKNEVLRLQVALAAARQQVIAVEGMVQQARAALALQLGGRPGEAFELDPTPPAFAQEPPPALDSARTAALNDRPELAEGKARVRQAEAGTDATRAKLLPDLNLIGQYQHSEGNTFADEDSFFGGLFLSWTAWEWGATARQVDAAEHQAEGARAMVRQAEKGISLDVESAHVEHATASSAISVAERAVAQAEEALRLEKARLEAQQATTTDVINAETALLQARVNLENARYDRLVARARLRSAMGQPVLDAQNERTP